jgi:hypothetical protein
MKRGIWRTIYAIYPPILRLLERLRIHNYRQEFPVGRIKAVSIRKIERHLEKKGFEKAILTWKDPGEILNMRKVVKGRFQYHVRIFKDRQVTGHYEFSSEGNPLGHVTESVFEPRTRYFRNALAPFLK